jgi:Fur family transcriptional regulator, ferric uptake regulator
MGRASRAVERGVISIHGKRALGRAEVGLDAVTLGVLLILSIMSDLELIVQRLELRGHRITASRRRVIEALVRAPAHFTVEEVAHLASRVGRATVFRTMKLLQDLNVVCRVRMEDGSLHYRLSTRGHHHHLVCRTCGRVEDFSICDVSSLVDELARNTAYQIEGHWLEVYGQCASCRILAGIEVSA